MPAGRPTSYTEAIGIKICERLSNGKSLETICKARGMPSSTTVQKWKRDYPEFLSSYAQAREDQGEYYGQKVQDVAVQVLCGEVPPDVARVAMDGFKWTAARMNRALYGDRQELTGKDGGPLEMNHNFVGAKESLAAKFQSALNSDDDSDG